MINVKTLLNETTNCSLIWLNQLRIESMKLLLNRSILNAFAYILIDTDVVSIY